jgi:predicted DsbA family dithiol-disulfide isomerase
MEIDVYQDTVCPWCRIGKAHLNAALAQWQGEPVTVRYRTFFLNDQIPAEGYEFRSYMQAKGGGRVPLEQFFDAPRRAGAAAGLVFDFERIERAPNSECSHRLIALAPEEQREAILDAVYAAYFEHGQDIGDIAVLLDIAAAHGMDRAATEAQLRRDDAAAAVRAEAREAHELGVTGVPFFVFNGRYGLSGAQPPHVILQALEMAAKEEAGAQ